MGDSANWDKHFGMFLYGVKEEFNVKFFEKMISYAKQANKIWHR